MNDTAAETTETAAAEYRVEADECIRRNPGSALLVAIGAGVAIGLIVRALRPAPTPQERMTRVLEDLEDRLRGIATPVLRRAGALASDGLDAAHHAAHHAAHNGEARVERFLGDATRRLRRFFS